MCQDGETKPRGKEHQTGIDLGATLTYHLTDLRARVQTRADARRGSLGHSRFLWLWSNGPLRDPLVGPGANVRTGKYVLGFRKYLCLRLCSGTLPGPLFFIINTPADTMQDCYPRLAEEAFVAINTRNLLTFGLT